MLYDGSSTLAVFDAIANCREISRAELSKITGFSQVTIGKAVDALEACGIVTQYKKERSTVGRKTGICRLNERYGMLVFDYDCMRFRVTDINLNELGEFELKNIEDSLSVGFLRFAELFDGELIGIGCIVPEGKMAEYSEKIREIFGQAPELLVDSGSALTLANSKRFDISSIAVFLRIRESVSGSIMLGDRLFRGARGRAGDFSRIFGDKAELSQRLPEICAMLDPEFIHIASDDVLSIPDLPEGVQLIVERFDDCKSAIDGALLMLRENWVRSKIEQKSE